jgi:hypothetical protein
MSLFGYLLTQGIGITCAGFILGFIEALIIGGLIPLRTAGISIEAVIDINTLFASVGFAVVITLAGAGIPAIWFSQQNLVELMKAEG